MALIFRTFRSRPGQDRKLIESLREAAWNMLQSEPGSVVISRTYDPREIVWVGHRGTDSEFARLPLGIDLAGSCEEDAVARCWPTLSLTFVDEWYRFPAPPYQVWNFAIRAGEANQLEAPKELSALSLREDHGSHVVGRSLYRAITHPSVLIGFVGLRLGWLSRSGVAWLRGTERTERGVIWRPLSIVHKIERAPGRVPRATGGREASDIPFWPRSVTFRAPPMPNANSDEVSVATEYVKSG